VTFFIETSGTFDDSRGMNGFGARQEPALIVS